MLIKYMFIIITFVFFLTSPNILNGNIPIEKVKEVFNGKYLENVVLKSYNEKKDKYEMSLYYPTTKYDKLNQEIIKKIDLEKEEFLNQISKLEKSEENKYKLGITFMQYEYNSYISFAFDVSFDLRGAHPTNHFFTVIYDTNKDEIITTENLIKKDNNFLNNLSEEVYKILKEDENIKDYSSDENLKEGLKPITSNFENIVFDKEGIIVFIDTYQVAPYVAGSFEIKIPYDKIFSGEF